MCFRLFLRDANAQGGPDWNAIKAAEVHDPGPSLAGDGIELVNGPPMQSPASIAFIGSIAFIAFIASIASIASIVSIASVPERRRQRPAPHPRHLAGDVAVRRAVQGAGAHQRRAIVLKWPCGGKSPVPTTVHKKSVVPPSHGRA
jgi:hypothetical protein